MTDPAPPANELDRKVVRTSPMLWVLGVIFALFLSSLGTQALEDLRDVFPEPQPEQFEQTTVKPLQDQRKLLEAAPDPRKIHVARAERDLNNMEKVLASAEASWETWLRTRGTLGGTSSEDQAVRTRRNHLDKLRRERDEAEKALNDLKAAPDPREAQLAALDKRIEAAKDQANSDFQTAHAAWSWKLFGLRMALIIPLWALAVFLWARRQNSKYITLMWGYWGFTTWMLLYGVWPFLPHYGVYVPMTLGALTTVWVAVTLVRYFNRQAPQRRRRIVDQAIARHICPGCERSYLTGAETHYDQGIARRAKTFHYDAAALRPRTCPACKLPLFGTCRTCGHEQIMHMDYCSACGDPWQAAVASS